MQQADPRNSGNAHPDSPAADAPFRNRKVLDNVTGNLRRLLTGKAVSALLQVIATLLMARTLTPTEFGLVILLHSYVLVWNGLFNFKLFEAIIRYGVPALDRNDPAQLLRLLKLGFLVDVGTSLGATIFAIGSAGLIGRYLGWDAEFVDFAMLASLVLLAGVTGTSKGILRLFNRFDLLSMQLAIAAIIQFIGCGIAWYMQWGMPAFIVIWALAMLCESLYLLSRGIAELRRQIPQARLRAVKLGHWRQEFPGMISFTNVVYWQSNLDLIPKQASNLLVGLLLGPESAGLFRLANGLSKVLTIPAVFLRQVLFPDLTRIWNRGEAGFNWILIKTTTTAAACGLIIVFIMLAYGATLLETLAGAGYAGAATVLGWLLFAATLDLCSAILRAAAYAMGNAGRVLRLNIVSMLVYIVTFVGITSWIGIAGPGIAATCAAAVTFTGMIWLVARKR